MQKTIVIMHLIVSRHSHRLHKGKKQTKVSVLHKAVLTVESQVLGRCVAKITKIQILILIKMLFLRRRESMLSQNSLVQHTLEREKNNTFPSANQTMKISSLLSAFIVYFQDNKN